MDVYLVGGAVRDELLGREVCERDWVVVGATVDEMIALGFRQVGRDFPVFLHPETGEEYALARTERKTGSGHTGFTVHAEPSVTLEEDLARRDLTINAMAKSADGRLIDPYNGVADLKARRLRHVSEAFAEDPLRVFRLARFCAVLTDFQIAPETRALAAEMAAQGALSELSAERVWGELAKALDAPAPGRFVVALEECNALEPWFDEFEAVRPGNCGDLSEQRQRFAVYVGPLHEEQITRLSERLKAPGAHRRMALWLCRWGGVLREWRTRDLDLLHEALAGCQAFREPVEFRAHLRLVQEGGGNLDELEQAVAEARDTVRAVEFQSRGIEGVALGQALRDARMAIIDRARGRSQASPG